MAGEKILIVDDERIINIAFQRELGQSGFEVDSAESGQEAIEKAKTKNYDIIFIDMVMPGMDGIDTCRAIKKIAPASKMVLITGQIFQDLSEKEEQLTKGNEKIHHFLKPFEKGEVLKITREVLSKRKGQRSGHSKDISG